MHSYLRTVGFSKVKSRKEMQEIIQDVINTYDEKIAVENHPDGVFVQYSKNYGCDCGITVCGQYDEDNEFHVEYSFPFFRGTGITSQESVVVERLFLACDRIRSQPWSLNMEEIQMFLAWAHNHKSVWSLK